MMSADDEPHLDELNSLSLNDASSKPKVSNALTNDLTKSFNLPTLVNPIAITPPTLIPPLKTTATNAAPPSTTQPPNTTSTTTLPTTANYFQPILSNTSDIKEPSKFPDFLASSFPNIESTKSKTPVNFTQKSQSASPSILAPPIMANLPNISLAAPSANIPSLSLTQSNPPMVLTPQVSSPQAPQSSIAPPLSSVPPLSSAPPLAVSQAPTIGSNPYSARGALNKKIYEPAPTAPSTLNTSTLPSVLTNSAPIQPNQNIFIPPPSSEPSSFQAPPIVTSNSPQQIPGPPSFNLSPSTPMPPFSAPSNFNQPPPITQNYNAPPMQSSLTFSDHQNQQQNDNQSKMQQKNVWNWLTQNRIVNTIKTGVETVITTIDPQMKDYIHDVNKPIFVLSTLTDRNMNDAIRDAFNAVGFLKVTIHQSTAAASVNYANQIVGAQNALLAAQEKLNSIRPYIRENCLLLIQQDFITEMSKDCWFDQMCVLLCDTEAGKEIVVYTEAIPVPLDYITSIQQRTPDTYPFKWSGYAVRLSENANVDWYETTYGIQKKTVLTGSVRLLASLYKHKAYKQQ